MTYRFRHILSVGLLALTIVGCSSSHRGSRVVVTTPLKREFRGAWLPTIFRGEYASLSRDQARDLLSRRIEVLYRLGCNAVIFQVRAEGDAWYKSSIEPWSKYLTGTQGVAPSPSWDPLAFVIEECHRRGMELHAWLNPYRGASNASSRLAANHLASQHPDWFVRYNKQLVLDPGLPQSRGYIVSVVRDIVGRYDVDAIHLDDYFYPYPSAEGDFPDDESFSRYGLPVGYTPETKGNWRRNNVNLLIHDIKRALLELKPWVKLGVSPFGIYRNKSEEVSMGSNTRGLQAYDDLYADVLHWVRERWVDYVAPQVYWNLGNEVADYGVLADWWAGHVPSKKGVQLYLGQDVKRTMDGEQLHDKLAISRELTDGNVWWPADELLRNYKNIGDSLSSVYQPNRAMLPIQKGSLGKTVAPAPIQAIWEDTNEDGHMLMWEDVRQTTDPEKPYYYAVYGFAPGVKVDLRDPRALLSVSTNPYYTLPYVDGATPYTFVVTTLNRFWQESKPFKLRVRI